MILNYNIHILFKFLNYLFEIQTIKVIITYTYCLFFYIIYQIIYFEKDNLEESTMNVCIFTRVFYFNYIK